MSGIENEKMVNYLETQGYDYKKPENEKKDPYAIWFVSATSPLMQDGSFEYGDTYVKDILNNGVLRQATDEWKKAYA